MIDSEKSRVGEGMQRFTCDSENRLIQAQTWHGATLYNQAHYHYDALGRRVEKQVTYYPRGNPQTKKTTFLWQGLRLLQEQQPQRHSTYAYEPDSYAPLARIDHDPTRPEQPGQVYYFHNDQIGTPQEMTNAEGQVVWRAYYKAWGGLEALTQNPEQNLRFQGQYHDRETGLYYNTFRYYDPAVGRFTTQDPIGLMGGINLYQYAPNALGWVDPWGLSCSPKVAKSGKVVNDLNGFTGKDFHFGNQTLRLDKRGMKHILERHHPKYWDGSIKAKQSFLSGKMSIDDVSKAVGDVMKQNRSVLSNKGGLGQYQITGKSNGVEYVVGLKNGRVGQFYPK